MSKYASHISAEEKEVMQQILRKKFRTRKLRPHIKNQIITKILEQTQTHQLPWWKRAIHTAYKTTRSLAYITAMAGFTLSLGATSIYAYVSPSVTREHSLYFLKQSIESLEVAVAFSEEDKAEKLLKMADRRTQEVAFLSSQGIIDEPTISQISENTQKAVAIVQNIKSPDIRAQKQDTIDRRVEQQQATLQTIITKLEENNTPIIVKKSSDNGNTQTTIAPDDVSDLDSLILPPHQANPSQTPDPLADLTISNITLFHSGKNTTAEVTISNIGDARASGIEIVLSGANADARASIFSLDAGDSQTISFSLSLPQNDISQITATADAANSVPETNEANNTRSVTAEPFQDTDQDTENTCENSCTIGTRRCSNQNAQICTEQPNGCGQWRTEVTCAQGQSCSAGLCFSSAPTPSCNDACTDGARICQNGTPALCTRQSNGCTAWKQQANCAIGQTCQNGQCITPTPRCTDQCELGAKRCLNDSSVQTCVRGSTACSVWGASSSCDTNSFCQSGSCQQYPEPNLPPGWNVDDLEQGL